MYFIYGNIYQQYTPRVSIYTSTLEPTCPLHEKKNVKATSATSCPGRMEPQAAKAPPETDLEDLWPVANYSYIIVTL